MLSNCKALLQNGLTAFELVSGHDGKRGGDLGKEEGPLHPH